MDGQGRDGNRRAYSGPHVDVLLVGPQLSPHPCTFRGAVSKFLQPIFCARCLIYQGRLESYIFSGASIPNKSSAVTSCVSTNSVSRSRNVRFCSSVSDKM